MTNYTFNSNPNELTSFEGGASPESSATFLKYFLDFVRPSSSNSSDNGSGSATTEPSAGGAATTSLPVNREPGPEPAVSNSSRKVNVLLLIVLVVTPGFKTATFCNF